MLSRLFLVLGAAPVLAPTLGGELLRFTSWRGIFAVLAVYGLLLIAVGWFALRETLPPSRRSSSGVAGTLHTYRRLLRDRTLVGLVLVAGLTMAGLFSYVSGSSFVFQRQFGLDEQEFGLLFGAGAVWLIAATQLNPLVLRRWTSAQVLVAGTVAGALSGAVLLVLSATGTGGLPGVVVPLWAMLFASGLALPNAPALALSRHGDSAGAAARCWARSSSVSVRRCRRSSACWQRRRGDGHGHRRRPVAGDRRARGRRPPLAADRRAGRARTRRRPLTGPRPSRAAG
jgi:DHA1 family bicyclomycin/chloramphenicol resistance-like MFS transporter